MNKFFNQHQRRSIRLKGFDYSKSGLYYITICTMNRECLFGEIIDKQIFLNNAGKMVETEWLALPNRFPNIQLHEYIVMPNHFHSILEIVQIKMTVGATLVVAQNNTGVAQNNTGVAQNNTGVAQNNTGVEHNNTGVEHNNTGVEHNNTVDKTRATTRVAPTHNSKTIGDIMDAFKSITTVNYARGVKTMNWKPFNKKLWQRNYYEHIIRNDESFQRIKKYIIENPLNCA